MSSSSSRCLNRLPKRRGPRKGAALFLFDDCAKIGFDGGMNDLEQEIAIAKACGWEHTKTVNNPEPSAYGRHPIHTADVKWDLPLPDYLNDLNAMHEAEKRLGDGTYLWDRYCDFLGGSLYHCAHATAAKRAEAFLKTLYLWKP